MRKTLQKTSSLGLIVPAFHRYFSMTRDVVALVGCYGIGRSLQSLSIQPVEKLGLVVLPQAHHSGAGGNPVILENTDHESPSVRG